MDEANVQIDNTVTRRKLVCQAAGGCIVHGNSGLGYRSAAAIAARLDDNFADHPIGTRILGGPRDAGDPPATLPWCLLPVVLPRGFESRLAAFPTGMARFVDDPLSCAWLLVGPLQCLCAEEANCFFQSSLDFPDLLRTRGIAAIERHSGGRVSRTPSPASMLA
jgi:hypothetical protein